MKYYRIEPTPMQRISRIILIVLFLCIIVGLLIYFKDNSENNEKVKQTPIASVSPTPTKNKNTGTPDETPMPTPDEETPQTQTIKKDSVNLAPTNPGFISGDESFSYTFLNQDEPEIVCQSLSDGMRCYNKKDYENAVKYLSQEIETKTAEYPDEHYWFLGQAYEKLNMPKEAENAYDDLYIKYDKSTYVPMVWAKLGKFALKNNDEKTALFYFNKIFSGDETKTKKYRYTRAGREIGVILGDIFYDKYCSEDRPIKTSWWMIREAYSMSYPFIKDKDVRAKVKKRLDYVNKYLIFGSASTETKYTIIHKVKPEDRLGNLAHKVYMVPDHESIMNWNGLSDPTKIQPGQNLKIIRGASMIIVDKSAFTLTLYLDKLYTAEYKVGLGKHDKTPIGNFIVQARDKEPTWHAPNGRQYEFGEPENILGTRWIAIGDGYGIHGTKFPESIGLNSSNGCVRMLNENVEALYNFVHIKDKVIIID